MAVQALIPIGMWVYRIGSVLYKTRQAAVAARLVQAGGKLIKELPKTRSGRPGDGAKDITPKNVNTIKQVDKIVGIKPGQGANVKTQILSDAKEQVQEDKKRLDDLRKKEEKRTKTLSSESRRQKSQVKVTKLPKANPAARPGNVKPKAVTEPYMDTNQKDYKIGDVVLPKDRGRNTKGDAQDNNPNKKAKTPPATPRGDPKRGDKAAPGTRTPKTSAPKTSLRPKLRPDASKKYNTVGAAQKAGQLYFYDRKSGEKKVAVTVEQLKKSGKSLTSWTNDEIKKRKTKLNKGGMMAKKSGYAEGGMAMVMKNGKKVPAFAADGVGKMNMGGMAKKKPAAKMMAGGMAKKKPVKMMGGGMTKSSGYMYGGMAKKKPAAKKK